MAIAARTTSNTATMMIHTAGESRGISEEKWLAALDDFRNWLVREAA
jgi:hypothetical protein